MTTLVLAPGEFEESQIELEAERFHHLFRVRRLRVGDALRVTDGAGRARHGRVTSVDRGMARVELGAAAPANEPRRRVELLVAAPRPQRAGWLVEKATELGATAIRFVDCERSPRRYGGTTLRRLERLAVAAVEQCERALVPEVSGPHAWQRLAELLADYEGHWVLDPSAEPGWPEIGESSGSHAVLVGPEGGFTADEKDRLSELDCRPVGLGARVLRVETAALVALAFLVTPSVDTARSRSVG